MRENDYQSVVFEFLADTLLYFFIFFYKNKRFILKPLCLSMIL